MSKSQRRKASMLEDGVDLISNLPDHVLPLILSGLPSTKESIRTSILSRRWRYLWTSLPSLDLEYGGGRKRSEEKSKFKNIVYWALSHRSVDLDGFCLSCSDYYSTPTLERWIHLTVMRNVKQLELSFWPNGEPKSDDMVIPHCLVTCASLEVLKLCLGRRLILPRFSGFTALRVLELEKVELFDNDLVKYILDCPLLEDLTLVDCRLEKLDLLCISSPKLKKLSFNYWMNNDLCGCLKLSCPNLVFLLIQGRVASNYIFEGLCSLKEVVIDTDSMGLFQLFHTISPLFHIIQSLTTDLCFLNEYIDASRDPALPNLKSLELDTVNAGYMVKALNRILKICPKVESLSLTITEIYSYENNPEDYDESEYPKLDGVGTRNLTRDVKWVEFFELNGEKPKLTIDWYDNNKSEWKSVVAKWGNEANFSHYFNQIE